MKTLGQLGKFAYVKIGDEVILDGQTYRVVSEDQPINNLQSPSMIALWDGSKMCFAIRDCVKPVVVRINKGLEPNLFPPAFGQ